MSMRLGILGSGMVGRALGTGFASLGYAVKMGTRTPGREETQAWVRATGAGSSAGSFAEAAEFGELLVLATRWSGTEDAISLAGAERFSGKVVIDVTNPLVSTPDAPPSLAVGFTDSGGEQVQRWLPGARVVKAFNIVGAAHMVRPQFPSGPPDMFFCGDDGGARRTVAEICTAFGWTPVDIGGMTGARLLEPLCILWILYGIHMGGWDHAFKMLRK